MAYNKVKYLDDLDLVEYSRSKYIINKEQYIGKRYNSLILKDIVCDTRGYVYGVCDCTNCGNTNIVTAIKKLINFETYTCGCSRNAGTGFNSKYNSDYYIGKIYGNLRVDSYFFSENKNGKGVFWNTTCMLCDKHKIFKASLLVNGTTTSCGCALERRNNKYSCQSWIGMEIDGTKIIDIGEKTPYGQTWICKCKYCNKPYRVLARKVVSGHTNSCGCTVESMGVTDIKRYLIENNIRFVQEWKTNKLLSKRGYPLRYDFALLDTNNSVIAFIEYDGSQHTDANAGFGSYSNRYANYLDILDSDDRKNRFASEHNIPLCRISYSRQRQPIINDLQSFIYKLKNNIEGETLC